MADIVARIPFAKRPSDRRRQMLELFEWASENGCAPDSDFERRVFTLTCPDPETASMALLRFG